MYKRYSDGAEITWETEETSLAEQAIESVYGSVPNSTLIVGEDISKEDMQAIRDEFERLHVEKHGSDSRFSDS